MAQHPMPPKPKQSRAGHTLAEQLVVMAVTGVLAALAVSRAVPLLDALAVHTAAQEIVDLAGTARDIAVARQSTTAIHIDAANRRLTVHTGRDTLARTVLPKGVSLLTSRDSLAYAPSGLGHGATNARLIVTRGRAADTLTISRLGRVARQ